MVKEIETQEEQVVANVREYEDHFIVSGFVHVKFNDKTQEIDFSKTIMK